MTPLLLMLLIAALRWEPRYLFDFLWFVVYYLKKVSEGEGFFEAD